MIREKSSGKILFLTMHSLRVLDRARKVRSFFLHKSLSRLADVCLIEGNRLERSLKLLRYLFFDIFRTRAVYVESCTTTALPNELAFLVLAKLLGRKIFIFIPDAYPLFPREFPAKSLKVKVLYFGWRVSVAIYRLVSTKLIFPSESLAKVFNLTVDKYRILPPGGSVIDVTGLRENSKTLGYVGELTAKMGLDLMVKAMRLVRKKYPDAELIIVGNLNGRKKFDESWVRSVPSDYSGLGKALGDCSFCLIPRPQNGYNLLTLPIKLFDYMSLGKAILSTNIPEVAGLIKEERVGVVCGDTPGSLAGGILYMFEHPKEVRMFRRNALNSIREKHSWGRRAEWLLDIIENETD